jgi:tetratricopeptide (TPR) repeat protein
VGEPTGGRPTHFGDNQRVSLPHHPDLLVFVSHWVWQARLPWDDRPWIAPHLPATLTSTDYRENHDPAFEAILAHRAEPTLAEVLRPKVQAGEYGPAAAAYRAYKQRHPDRWGRTSEEEVNQLGYSLLGRRQARAAVMVLALNVESYPRSGNAYDSLAEATLATGDKARAIELYRKALELDPSLRSSRRMLEQLTRD